MNNELMSYVNESGHSILTAHYLKKRGTCCKSACLHCPYGFTLKKNGLTFHDVDEKDSSIIDKIISDSGNSSINWKEFSFDNIKLIKLKSQLCGVLLKNHLVVKHLYLKPEFQHQGLSKEIVESYYFI
jgi:hypothetical protein